MTVRPHPDTTLAPPSHGGAFLFDAAPVQRRPVFPRANLSGIHQRRRAPSLHVFADIVIQKRAHLAHRPRSHALEFRVTGVAAKAHGFAELDQRPTLHAVAVVR